MITLPSCDMRSPAPIPKKMSDTAKAVAFRFTSIVPTSTSAAIAIAARPSWTTARGPNRTATFGPVSAAASIEIDIGKSRLPVSKASKPSTTLEVHRQDEERAHHDQLLRGERGQAAAQRLDLQQRATLRPPPYIESTDLDAD
jgi:hypothetical protein